MVGLDPTIRNPWRQSDPRAEPEDGGVLGAMFVIKPRVRGSPRPLVFAYSAIDHFSAWAWYGPPAGAGVHTKSLSFEDTTP